MLCQLLMFDDYSTAAETTPHVLDLATFEDICRRKFGMSTHEVSPERLRVLFRVLDLNGDQKLGLEDWHVARSTLLTLAGTIAAVALAVIFSRVVQPYRREMASKTSGA